MGTRGIIGFITPAGELHGAYNQYDMYPSGVGTTLQEEIREICKEFAGNPWDTLRAWIADMRYVDARERPTEEEQVAYKASWEKVSDGEDWYAYLREHQGSLVKRLRAGVMTDDPEFLRDSLFCEWAYVFDLQTRHILILKGFNNDPDRQWHRCRLTPEEVRKEKLEATANRQSVYYGCAVAWLGDIDAFLDLDMKAFEEAIYAEKEEA